MSLLDKDAILNFKYTLHVCMHLTSLTVSIDRMFSYPLDLMIALLHRH